MSFWMNFFFFWSSLEFSWLHNSLTSYCVFWSRQDGKLRIRCTPSLRLTGYCYYADFFDNHVSFYFKKLLFVAWKYELVFSNYFFKNSSVAKGLFVSNKPIYFQSLYTVLPRLVHLCTIKLTSFQGFTNWEGAPTDWAH